MGKTASYYGGRIQSVVPDYQDFLLDSTFAWFESALLDLVGRLKGMPVHALFGSPVREGVDAYDGTLYFKDVEQETGPEVIGKVAARIQEDGYRALKMKVGRLQKWMGTKKGLQRALEAVLAARNAVGSNFNIMADANDGYEGRLQLGLRFLQVVAPHDLYWIEELIPEDQQMYRRLRQTMFGEGMDVRTAEGENTLWADKAASQQPSGVKT